jgi:hypothetical protein
MSTTATTGLTLTIPVRDGCLMPSGLQKNAIAGYLAPFNGYAVAVNFSKPHAGRSNSQNSYYWGVVIGWISTETGHTPEEVHAAVKDMFLPRKFVRLGNHEHEQSKSTKELSTDEFEKYLDQVRAWAANDLGIRIPLPNE